MLATATVPVVLVFQIQGGNFIGLVRTMEGFYDTALNEASSARTAKKLYQGVAKEPVFSTVRIVKTMLLDVVPRFRVNNPRQFHRELQLER